MFILMQTKGALHMKNDKKIIRCNINTFLQLAFCLNNLGRDFLKFLPRKKNRIIF